MGENGGNTGLLSWWATALCGLPVPAKNLEENLIAILNYLKHIGKFEITFNHIQDFLDAF